MRHQELWRAVGTHYGPTRIYRPMGHAIGGTAQQALWSLPTAAIAGGPLGLDTISDDYGPATTCRRMDLAAAAGARATRLSLLWAEQLADEGWSDTALRDRRLRDRREWADASVQSTGLGVATSASRRGMCRIYCLD